MRSRVMMTPQMSLQKKEVNDLFDNNMSPTPVASCVRKGLIDTSPLK